MGTYLGSGGERVVRLKATVGIKIFEIVGPENTILLRKGKYRCMADLLFDWFRIDQTSKSGVHST